eukprot:g26003.t1
MLFTWTFPESDCSRISAASRRRAGLSRRNRGARLLSPEFVMARIPKGLYPKRRGDFSLVKEVKFTFNVFDKRSHSLRETLRTSQSTAMKNSNPKTNFTLDVRDEEVAPRISLEFLNGHKYSFPTTVWTEKEIMEKVHLRSLELYGILGLRNPEVVDEDDWIAKTRDEDFVEADDTSPPLEALDQPIKEANKPPKWWNGKTNPMAKPPKPSADKPKTDKGKTESKDKGKTDKAKTDKPKADKPKADKPKKK